MCGIIGIVSCSPINRARLETMTATLRHRGPDDSAIWLSADRRVALGHRRLAILDLSPLGRNPMPWDDGHCKSPTMVKYTIITICATSLKRYGYRFRSNTDTEVILAAYDRWGIEASSDSSACSLSAFGIRAQSIIPGP